MKLLEALAGLTQQDLDDINQKIAEGESQLEKFKELRRVIEIQLGVKKPRVGNFRGRKKAVAAETNGQPPTAAQNTQNDTNLAAQLTVTEQYRIDAKRYIMANGPAKAARICNQTGIPLGSAGGVFKHKWFRTTEHGVDLTPEAFKS